MSTSLPIFYDCLNCPSYCCTYPRIPVSKRDLKRLAGHFGISEARAEEEFTKPGWTKRERVMRHQKDEIFGSACRFLDLETRLCTVHEARPSVCRGHPDGPNCGYYTFLMSERRDQDDPDYAARAYNLPNEFPRLAEEWEKGEAEGCPSLRLQRHQPKPAPRGSPLRGQPGYRPDFIPGCDPPAAPAEGLPRSGRSIADGTETKKGPGLRAPGHATRRPCPTLLLLSHL